MPVTMSQNPLYVAGPKHYQNRFAELGEGELRGLLVREPDNRWDANAIMVMTEDASTKLGYVPKWRAKEWAPLFDAETTPRVACQLNIRPPDPDSGLYSAEILSIEGAAVTD